MKKNEKINIVIFNMSAFSEWERGIQNRNFHILKNLRANGKIGKIVAIDYLPHNFKRSLKNYKENILKISDSKVVFRSPFSKAIEIDQQLTVYSSVLSIFSKNKFYEELKKFLKKLNFKDYIVWSYYPLEVDYFEKLKPQLFVFDTVDNWSEHPSYIKFKQRLQENYKIIDQKANLILTVADELQSLYANREKVHWIPNGVDLKHYQGDYPVVNRDIGEIAKPIIGYVGTIQDRMDQELLEYLVKTNPDKSFVMVGPVWYKEIKNKFSIYKNIYFLGRKSYQEVPMYIQQFDVGIIPHKVDKFVESTNPMKIYEYLACGKPVVSTKGSGVEMFKEFIGITDDFQQFNKLINQSISKDNEKLREKRLNIIKDHSWLKRVERIMDLILQKL